MGGWSTEGGRTVLRPPRRSTWQQRQSEAHGGSRVTVTVRDAAGGAGPGCGARAAELPLPGERLLVGCCFRVGRGTDNRVSLGY
jgi:hypothetical protein